MPGRSRSATACSSARAPICRCSSITTGNCRRSSACRSAIVVSLVLAVIVGMPTFRLTGHYFSMATIAVAELIRLVVGTWDFVGAAIGLQGPAVGRGWYDLTFRGELPYYFIFLAVLAILLFITWQMRAQPLRLLPARHQGGRARRALARRAGAPHQALRADAERDVHLDRAARSTRSRPASSIRKAASAFWSRCRW